MLRQFLAFLLSVYRNSRRHLGQECQRPHRLSVWDGAMICAILFSAQHRGHDGKAVEHAYGMFHGVDGETQHRAVDTLQGEPLTGEAGQCGRLHLQATDDRYLEAQRHAEVAAPCRGLYHRTDRLA